jgi:hypothetical protein
MGGGDRGFFEQSEPNLRFGAGQYVIILLSKKCIKKTTFKGRFMFPYRSLEPHLRTPNPGLNPRLPPFYITNARGKGGTPPRVKPGVWRRFGVLICGPWNNLILELKNYLFQ